MAKKDKKETKWFPRTIDYAGPRGRSIRTDELDMMVRSGKRVMLQEGGARETAKLDVKPGLSNYEFAMRCARYYKVRSPPEGLPVMQGLPRLGEAPGEDIEEYGGGWTLSEQELQEVGSEEHVFEVEPKVVVLLEQTDVDWSPVRLPFPHVFLDGRFAGEDRAYYGIRLRELPIEHAPGFPVIYLDAFYWHDEDPHIGHVHFALPWRKPPKGTSRDFVRQVRMLTRVMMNFVYILDQPEVKVIPFEPSEKSKRRAIARGFHPRPPGSRVKVRGELRVYLDRVRKGTRGPYTHAFWVRGHWRHYTAERYREARGTRRWVPPYVKGEGILVPKAYDVDPVWAKRRGPKVSR